MAKLEATDRTSLRPLLVVFALFIAALAGAASTTGPGVSHVRPEKAAPASQTSHSAVLAAQLVGRP